MLTDSGFNDLLENMPPQEMFEQKFGDKRRAGQAPHDRYSLEYTRGMPVPKPWKEFIAELCSDAYRKEIERLLGANKAEFRFHWHYTPSGADVPRIAMQNVSMARTFFILIQLTIGTRHGAVQRWC